MYMDTMNEGELISDSFEITSTKLIAWPEYLEKIEQHYKREQEEAMKKAHIKKSQFVEEINDISKWFVQI